jgi:hypothetical protein
LGSLRSERLLDISGCNEAGLKKEKAQISLVLCANATGNDRLDVWIIGKAKLKNINVATMGAQWRWNKKAWMNTTVMVAWLQAFYLHIESTRRVLLTMDNFSAHYTALELTCIPASRDAPRDGTNYWYFEFN